MRHIKFEYNNIVHINNNILHRIQLKNTFTLHVQ